jgi:hypothetical protein
LPSLPSVKAVVLPSRSAWLVSAPMELKHIASPVSCQVSVHPVPPQVLPEDLARVAWNTGGLV